MSTTTQAPPSDVTQDEQSSGHGRARTERIREALEKYGLLILLIVLLVCFSTMWDRPATFRSPDNVAAVIGTYSVPMILALATIIPLCCGQFDLTVGPVAGLSAIAAAGAL